MKAKKIFLGSTIGATLLTAGAISYLKLRKTIPANAVPVKHFDSEKYLGKWYEIARLDFHFEKDLINTTAEYSLNEDGSIKVVNKGFNVKKDKEEVSIGKAKFVNGNDEAKLKVSFFGPVYSGYNVLEIDKNYKYALVAGRNLNYLWFLSREKTMPEYIKQKYIETAKNLGYKTEDLVWINHNCTYSEA